MNRLRSASSPYLLQHQDNPVDWWEWGDAPFAEARRLGKPVLLSIGYAACHWCHVMAHESFEDEAVAAVMNELFVSIKVDREERPDVDHIYMAALHALGEQGGWPLTMFLTADREPFWGGTYFPKEPRYGRPGFAELLRSVAAIHRAEPGRIQHNVQALKRHLASQPAAAGDAPTDEELRAAAAGAASVFDPLHGGLRGAPKFPNAPILNLLWRGGALDPSLRAPALKTLERMARGGIHDHLGGGFARYAVDERWLVPHFEKMLYDNAQLLELYALAAEATGERLFAEAAEGIVAWLKREMTLPGGGFASSLDADSEGEEGRYYVWSRAELDESLGPEDAAVFARFYDVTPEGNFEGRSILNRLAAPDASDEEETRLAALREKLLAIRAARVPPGRDDKVLADWNGMMIAALARAGTLLNRPDWIALGRGAYRFVLESMTREHRLAHSWREHIGVWPGFALDYAAMALAALALAEDDDAPDARLAEAKRFLEQLAADYSESESGVLAMNAASGDALVVRPRPTHDDAVPNANGVYLEALLRYAQQALDDDSLALADRLFRRLAEPMRRQALAHASLWSAFDFRLRGASVVVGGVGAEALRRAALAVPWPERTVTRLAATPTVPPGHPAAAMLAEASDRPRAFVCVGERCSLPVERPEAIAAEMAAARPR